MKLHDPLHDRKTETRTSRGFGSRRVYTKEAIKHPRQCIGGYTDFGVGYFDQNVDSFATGCNRDRTARGGVRDRIGNQIPNNPLHQCAIEFRDDRPTFSGAGKNDSGVCGRSFVIRPHSLQQFRNIDCLQPQVGLSASYSDSRYSTSRT